MKTKLFIVAALFAGCLVSSCSKEESIEPSASASPTDNRTSVANPAKNPFSGIYFVKHYESEGRPQSQIFWSLDIQYNQENELIMRMGDQIGKGHWNFIVSENRLVMEISGNHQMDALAGNWHVSSWGSNYVELKSLNQEPVRIVLSRTQVSEEATAPF